MPFADAEKRREYHREYMRRYNETHHLSDEQKAKKLEYMKAYAKKKAKEISEYQKGRYVRQKARISARKSAYKKSPRGRLKSYMSDATKRGLDFNLTTEDFNLLLSSPCHYCGKAQANGVDRVNNDIGYYSYNAVACCKTCNFMKRDMGYDEFIEHIVKIINHFQV